MFIKMHQKIRSVHIRESNIYKYLYEFWFILHILQWATEIIEVQKNVSFNILWTHGFANTQMALLWLLEKPGYI